MRRFQFSLTTLKVAFFGIQFALVIYLTAIEAPWALVTFAGLLAVATAMFVGLRRIIRGIRSRL